MLQIYKYWVSTTTLKMAQFDALHSITIQSLFQGIIEYPFSFPSQEEQKIIYRSSKVGMKMNIWFV